MDLILQGGTIVTASETYEADLGIAGGTIKQIGRELGPAGRTIDVSGKYLFPGGVDVHTHVEFELLGFETVDDFHSSTVAAACGGVTTIVDYALPEPGQTLMEAVETWNKRAKGKTVRRETFDLGRHWHASIGFRPEGETAVISLRMEADRRPSSDLPKSKAPLSKPSITTSPNTTQGRSTCSARISTRRFQ